MPTKMLPLGIVPVTNIRSSGFSLRFCQYVDLGNSHAERLRALIARNRPAADCDAWRTCSTVLNAHGDDSVVGVIVRSSTNVAAGARTQASAILHGAWILVFSIALVGVVQQVPKSALAGLLVVVGVQLVKLAHIQLAHRTGDLAVYAVTMVSVVFLNLLEGVLIDLAVAFAMLLRRVVKVSVQVAPETGIDRWVVRVEGTCTFLALPKLATVPTGTDVLVELTVDFLGHAGYEASHDWARQHESAAGYDETAQLSMVNVAVQLETLRRHPVIRRAADARGLTVSGLFFDISTACMLEVTTDGVSEFDVSAVR
ncbi:SulP family inorganic anion transporter [Nocardia exalbida]|uniref:SulP family inorganic anion transporter n=1 Tax=Nocardia exalbida TaxID=290231 RepID=UPI000A001F36